MVVQSKLSQGLSFISPMQSNPGKSRCNSIVTRNVRVNSIKNYKKAQHLKSTYSTTKSIKLPLSNENPPALSQMQQRLQTKPKIRVLLAPKSKSYFMARGNNHSLVASILEVQGYQFSSKSDNAQMVWLQENKRFEYHYKKNSTLVNMFEFHQELTDKDKLYTNLKALCLKRGLDVNLITPVTFVLDLESFQVKHMLTEFLRHYLNNHPKISKLRRGFSINRGSLSIKIKHKQLVQQLKPGVQQKIAKGLKSDTNYLWMIKPANQNRGRGIRLFSKLKTLQDELTGDSVVQNFKMYNQRPKEKQSKYIIQKYIQQPLLIQDRKFDIRVWVFIDPCLRCYFFKEGYLRLSGYNYSTSKDTINNMLVHLTNNAIQKNSAAYGTYQQGNQMSFMDFETFLNRETKVSYTGIIQRVKQVVRLTLDASIRLINPKNRKNCFQILGYDFLVDKEGHVWLIECNTNPCLQESSQLLSNLIPLLLKGCLKLLRGDQSQHFQRLA